jgi:hypothetical protein
VEVVAFDIVVGAEEVASIQRVDQLICEVASQICKKVKSQGHECTGIWKTAASENELECSGAPEA